MKMYRPAVFVARAAFRAPCLFLNKSPRHHCGQPGGQHTDPHSPSPGVWVLVCVYMLVQQSIGKYKTQNVKFYCNMSMIVS